MKTKTVFRNHSEVCHIWAQQTQNEGKASRIFFDGPTIYSYGRHFPMARFVDKNTVLFTTNSYSVSTAKHKRYARQAIPDNVRVFDVHHIESNHDAANVAIMLGEIKTYQQQAIKATKNGDMIRGYALSRVKDMREYIGRFKVKILEQALKKEVSKYLQLDIFSPAEIVKIKQANMAEKKRKADETRQREKDAAVKIEHWKAGGDVQLPYNIGRVFLRVEKEEIVTSKGARIPLAIGKRLWERVCSPDSINTNPNTDAPKVAGMNLGNYRINSWDGTTLTAGCHKIELVEMQRLAKILGW